MKINSSLKIGIVGLGYVGLPLLLEFGKYFSVVGYDRNKLRIDQLINGEDVTNEVEKKQLKNIKKDKISFTSTHSKLKNCNIFIVTVPTPINKKFKPDLKYIKSATKTISKYIKKGNIVVYESTVYPGTTEEVCVPILQKLSGLKFNRDFFCGFSPERINPGDKIRKITDIKKVTSGSNRYSSEFIDRLYKKIIKAGTHKAKSIKIAESSKVVENIQRNINIALINELSIIFNLMNVNTNEVLDAAKTKWNFIPFSPGLVGGHCIGVDPYYLTYKSKKIGYVPKFILSGLKVNEYMDKYISDKLIRKMRQKKIIINESKVIILGYTFKENCPDTRNTKIFNLVKNLERKKIRVDVYDPYVRSSDFRVTDINIVNKLKKSFYDGMIIAVPHNEFLSTGIRKLKSYCKKKSVIYDFKSVFKKEETDISL